MEMMMIMIIKPDSLVMMVMRTMTIMIIKPDSLASLRPSAAWLASSGNLLAIAISLAPAKVRRRRDDE